MTLSRHHLSVFNRNLVIYSPVKDLARSSKTALSFSHKVVVPPISNFLSRRFFSLGCSRGGSWPHTRWGAQVSLWRIQKEPKAGWAPLFCQGKLSEASSTRQGPERQQQHPYLRHQVDLQLELSRLCNCEDHLNVQSLTRHISSEAVKLEIINQN